VSWTAPTDDGGSAITNYQVEQRIGSGAWAPAATTTSIGASTSATVRGLTVGTSYAFRVRAVNSAGASDVSATASATPALSSADLRLTHDGGGGASGRYVERGYAFRLNSTVTIDALYGGGSAGDFTIRIRDGGTGSEPFARSTGLTVVVSGVATGSTALQTVAASATLQAGRWYWITQERTSGTGLHLTTTSANITAAIDRDLVRDWRSTTQNTWTGDSTLPALGFRVG
jgi:titin